MNTIKEVIPQDSVVYFPLLKSHMNGAFYYATTKTEKNKLILHYTLKGVKYKYDKNGFGDYKPRKTKKLTMKYHYKNGKWSTNDKHKIRKLDRVVWSRP